MNTKLTLSIDKEVIARAKLYAQSTQRSLSEIVQSYLEQITDQSVEQIDSELQEIVGVIELPKDFDDKQAIRDIITRKHQS